MTKEEAISKAADWWIEMMFAGVWDNGDAKTEALHNMFKLPGPDPSDAPLVRKVFLELLEMHPFLYSDYGNDDIDSMFRKHGLKLNSLHHCPQKAGTRIYTTNAGYAVEAKAGYGKNYEKL
jgi:hypothetical protein